MESVRRVGPNITWSVASGLWMRYGECPMCGAWPTEPCFDKRKRFKDGMGGSDLYIQRPHKGRSKSDTKKR
jgi:hypothetical protein